MNNKLTVISGIIVLIAVLALIACSATQDTQLQQTTRPPAVMSRKIRNEDIPPSKTVPLKPATVGNLS